MISNYNVLFLSSRIFQVGYQLIPLLFLFDASKNHLCAGNILFGVCKVDVKSVFAPNNACKVQSTFFTKSDIISKLEKIAAPAPQI